MLWSVVLLALLATGMTAAGRSDVQLAANIRRAAAAANAADAGIAAAVFHAGDAPAQAWAADGRPHRIPFGAYTITVRIADEDRKLNPNLASPDLMAALLAACGADPPAAGRLAQAIAAWHQSGARDGAGEQYRAAGRLAAPDGGSFRSIDDLRLVIGMTEPLLARLRPFLSVYAGTPTDLAQADPVVRQAVQNSAGGAPAPAATRPGVLDITSDAAGRDGSRFVRHAVVQLGADETGRLFRTVVWDTPPP